MTRWRYKLAAALLASICLLGVTADAAATPGSSGNGGHPKLDKKLNDRAENAPGGLMSRAIVVLYPGCDATKTYAKLNARKGRTFRIINADVVEVQNSHLKKLADDPCVKDMHWDRKTAGSLNRAAVVEGARAVQMTYGYDGAGVGVAVVDSGVATWHDDLTYTGSNPLVKVVGGQRVRKFVDFVNGRLTSYDDNGHGTHVTGIIAGNGFDTLGARAGIAPAANIVSLKVLDDRGGGFISNVIAALDWIAANRVTYNIRVVNLSVGAAVTESYNSDPLTLAAKRVVDEGVVVVTAAGNLGKDRVTGKTVYGAITAPGNAPWVLTVGAYSHEGTLTRSDDRMAGYSSRGPTAIDYAAKPDIVATGTGIVSLSAPGSLLYSTKSAYLLKGLLSSTTRPYLSLSGTSMASPVVAGAVALMVQANPQLTPNLVKAILQYTAQNYEYDALTQGAGFLNIKGAVDLARFLKNPQAGQVYPSNKAWSKTILWGNQKLKNGVIKPAGSAWAVTTVWGAARDLEGDNIVWGTVCGTIECDNIVWGTSLLDLDNIVWGTFDREGDNIVWGTIREGDNIVWGTFTEADNIVWGTRCDNADCGGLVWGASVAEGELDNIVWGTFMEADNIVWGTSGEVDNIVWGTSSDEDNTTWGSSGEENTLFEDPNVPSVFDGLIFDALFDGSAPEPVTTSEPDAPLATEPETSTTTTVLAPVTTILGGGL
ncbi:MAG TPA: S8 family peptidase [Vicinamibacterales bacterium]|nr:S8 family peptidase [Vicinamibacterales bacterium]